jgi:hypothetical protein
VVITTTDGTPDGLLAFGDLTLTAGSQVSKGIFAGTPLLNAASVPVSTNTALSQDTGVAVVNVNSQAVNISLVLRFASTTVTPLTQTFTLGAGQQTSKFVTEVFGQAAIAQGVPAVLTLISSMPVGVVGFNFEGTNFSAVPVTDLSTVLSPSALATLNSDIQNSNSSALNMTSSPSSSLTLAPIAGVNVLVSNTTPAGQFFPQISTSVGGNGALILAQYATNGGWSNGIVIENPSQNTRTLRVDFFDSNGVPLNVTFQTGSGTSFTNISIPAFGTLALIPVS